MSRWNTYNGLHVRKTYRRLIDDEPAKMAQWFTDHWDFARRRARRLLSRFSRVRQDPEIFEAFALDVIWNACLTHDPKRSSERTWLSYRMAREAIDERKRIDRICTVNDYEFRLADMHDDIDEIDTDDLVSQIICCVQPMHREVVSRRLAGQQFDEIGTSVGLSPSGAYARWKGAGPEIQAYLARQMSGIRRGEP